MLYTTHQFKNCEGKEKEKVKEKDMKVVGK